MSRILDSGDIDRALKRIAHEIIERNQGISNLVILGIPTRGAYLSDRIAALIEKIEGFVPHGALDVTLHRDDLRLRPPRPFLPTSIPASGIEGKDVVLVDDVLYSGRTIRAALDALGDIGSAASEAVPGLITALEDEHFFVRESAARTLGKIGPSASAALPALRKARQDGRIDQQVLDEVLAKIQG